MKLTEREIELLNGMIEAYKSHAERCDFIQNRLMAEKQKGWDLERIALLEKIKKNTDLLLLDEAIKLIKWLCNHLPDSDQDDECWTWCWDELWDTSQASVKSARRDAEEFLKKCKNRN